MAHRKPFKPFKPPSRPPSGYYDIGLDQQLAAAQRGNQDLHADTETGQTRNSQDYATGTARLGQQRDQSLADILLGRNRLQQDYGTQTQDLNTQYTNLRGSQQAAANAAGVLGTSSWDQQAAQARAANQAHDQSTLDTSYQRGLADSQTAEQRLTDPNTGSYANSLADLTLQYQRGGQDSATQLSRSDRELGFFGTDTAATAMQQATQAGWTPPTRRPGENTLNGITYRRLPNGNAWLSSGRVVSRQGLRRLIRRAG